MGAGTSVENKSVTITPAKSFVRHTPSQSGSPAPASQPASPVPGANRGGDGTWRYVDENNGEGSSDLVAFNDAANDRIESAYKQRQKSVEISVGKHLYCIDFTTNAMRRSQGTSAANDDATSPFAHTRRVERVLMEAEPGDSRDKDAGSRTLFPAAGDHAKAAILGSEIENTVEHGRHIRINKRLANGRPGHVSLVSTAQAHNSLVYCASFDTAEGNTVVTGGRDGTLRCWEPDTGFVVREFDRIPAVVLNSVLAPGRSLVATGSDDARVRVYNMASSSPQAVLEGHEHKVYGIDCTSDSRSLVSGSMDYSMKLWDVKTQQCMQTYLNAHDGAVFTVVCSRFSPHMVVSGGDDCKMKQFDLRTPGKAVASYVGHSQTLWACDIRYDEAQLVSSGMDGTVLLWDPRQSGRVLGTLGSHGPSPVHGLEYCDQGRRVLSCSRDSTWRLWDADLITNAPSHEASHTDAEICRVVAHDGVVFAVTYSPARGQVLSIGADACVRLWDARLE
jgi:WD40 repeat protein